MKPEQAAVRDLREETGQVPEDVVIMEAGWEPAFIKIDSDEAPLDPDGLREMIMAMP